MAPPLCCIGVSPTMVILLYGKEGNPSKVFHFVTGFSCGHYPIRHASNVGTTLGYRLVYENRPRVDITAPIARGMPTREW